MAWTATRRGVFERSAEPFNERRRGEMAEHVRFYAEYPEEIEGRLWELDREWGMERALAADAAALSLAGLLLGLGVNRKFLLLPALMGAILLQHAVQRWCPPVLLLRWLGFRTQAEIEAERYVLKALRGDFEAVDGGAHGAYLESGERAERALSAVNA